MKRLSIALLIICSTAALARSRKVEELTFLLDNSTLKGLHFLTLNFRPWTLPNGQSSTGGTGSTSSGGTGTSTVAGGVRTLVSIAVTPANATINAGSTQQYTATGTYSDGSQQNITGSVTWTSTNTAVATIASGGLATAVAAGSTTIQATLSGMTGSTGLTVTGSGGGGGTGGSAGATAIQYVLAYTTSNSNQCTIEVSTNSSYSPVVPTVDATRFTNANMDGQTTVGNRAFVVGQKWIAQETVSPPSVTVGASACTFSSSPAAQVACNASNSFVVGDNVTVTGMGNTAFNDSWSRIVAASGSSFTYVLPHNTTASGTAGSGTVTRADRYSLALTANTTYYYRLGGASNTCGASPATGTFTTMNIPNGNTWAESSVWDATTGVQLQPTIFEDRTTTYADPLTGDLIRRMTLFSDYNTAALGWDSGFRQVCSIQPDSNGFYHCTTGLNGTTAGVYGINAPNNDIRWLGFGQYTFTDASNNTETAYVQGVAPSWSNSNPNLVYPVATTNKGNIPFKNVIVSVTYTGNDVPATGFRSNWSANPAVELTQEPSNTLDDLLYNFIHSTDPTFVAANFHGCQIRDVEGDLIQGICYAGAQGSPTYYWTYKISTSTILAAGPSYANQKMRWCGSHGATLDGSQKWMNWTTSYMSAASGGQWAVNLVSSILATDTSLTVTGYESWQATHAYDLGHSIQDSNGNLQIVTVAGTTGSTPPTWATGLGSTTVDGTVTWKNYGPTSSLTTTPWEPQATWPFTTGYQPPNATFTFLQATSGGADGSFGGDVFQILDPVNGNEYIRLLTKGSVAGSNITWTSVHRGIFGTTAKPHPAQSVVRCACEASEAPSASATFWWDFLDDIHLQDTTNTKLVNSATQAGHGFSRDPYIANGMDITCQGGCSSPMAPWTNTTLAGLPTLNDAEKLTFAGIATDSPGSTFQGYGTWDFQNNAFKASFIKDNYFGGGLTFNSFTKVGGTSFIYKLGPGSPPDVTFSPMLPYIGMQGLNRLLDISGPSSVLHDTTADNRKVCTVQIAGECITGSSPGDVYGNFTSIDNGVTSCASGGEVFPYRGNDWCMVNPPMYGVTIAQMSMSPKSNFLGNDGRGVPQYGASLSRRLTQTFFGPWRLAQSHMHVVPDGSYTIFESCMIDPHLGTNQGGYQNTDPYGCQILMAQIPPQPPADGIDRTNFENVNVTIGAGSGGATHATVTFGYRENEQQSVTSDVSWPPTIHFYCTQYQGQCYYQSGNFLNTILANATSLPLNSTQTLQIGVPQRVLFYQVEYLNGSNQLVATDPMHVVAIP